MNYLAMRQEMPVDCQAVWSNFLWNAQITSESSTLPVLKAKGLYPLLLCVQDLFTQYHLNGTEGVDTDFPWRMGMENKALNFRTAVQWQGDLLILNLC